MTRSKRGAQDAKRTNTPLAVLGTGLYLPSSRRVKDLVTEEGGNPNEHSSWEHACVAEDGDHPSTMGARALRAALRQAKVSAQDLDLVLYTGVSRDFPASWSVAMEIMGEMEIPGTCMGFDLTLGCLGAVLGMKLAASWLQGRPDGLAAVVCAERWSYTVDRKDLTKKTLWAHADGAGAIVLGGSPKRKRLGAFLGSNFITQHDMNGLIRVKYGGTRFPTPPHGELPFFRERNWDGPRSELAALYRAKYECVIRALRAAHNSEPDWVACNQVGPKFVSRLSGMAGVARDRVCESGHQYGHVGTVDVVIGLDQLLHERQARGDIYLLSSTHFAWGGGVVRVS